MLTYPRLAHERRYNGERASAPRNVLLTWEIMVKYQSATVPLNSFMKFALVGEIKPNKYVTYCGNHLCVFYMSDKIAI